jgi:protein-disulfide isomerase
MIKTRAPSLVALLASCNLFVGCNRSSAQTKAAPTPPEPSKAAKVDCSAEFPGLPLAALPTQSRGEFCRFAEDTLCYCGCPHTLAGCLKEHSACPHASRMAALALAEIANNGASAESAARFVAVYYDSFSADKRAHIDVSALPCMGGSESKVTIVEFSDFDCPHCKQARPLLEKLVKDRPEVKLCFLSFPLHKHSSLAAAAADYAFAKGAFWRYHDLLFDSQEARVDLDEAAYVKELVRLGKQAGLDEAGLAKAIEDPKLRELVEREKEAGRQLGVEGTPFIFLNGRPVPFMSPEMLLLTVQDELEWIRNDSHWAKD